MKTNSEKFYLFDPNSKKTPYPLTVCLVVNNPINNQKIGFLTNIKSRNTFDIEKVLIFDINGKKPASQVTKNQLFNIIDHQLFRDEISKLIMRMHRAETKWIQYYKPYQLFKVFSLVHLLKRW